MSQCKHKASNCRLCAPLRRPGRVKVRRALVAGLARQTRTNGENGGDA
ncbi:hypothetical protein OOK58_41965 [Streptomyces sp. NBC_01728]|nr:MULTISPECIES: hypothetical protein [unclassified Streptomyces]MCX4458481.1 hypothetical protein [Streptomyces sp. NBC_01719]MCX4497838.1 hypothetical protein [Streptomyces sp. NBC_01728]